MKGKIIRIIGVISTMGLSFLGPMIGGECSFLFFGELPIPRKTDEK